MSVDMGGVWQVVDLEGGGLRCGRATWSGEEGVNPVARGGYAGGFEGDPDGNLTLGGEGLLRRIRREPLVGSQHAPDQGFVTGVGDGDLHMRPGLLELRAIARGGVECEVGFTTGIGLDVRTLDGNVRRVAWQG